MADDTKNEEESNEKKSSMPLMMILGVLVIALLGAVGFVLMQQGDDGSTAVEEVPSAEHMVKERMYQLKDGSYLRLSFSIVVRADQVALVTNILDTQSPGRLPSGITMLLGNKTREDLIDGTHKREAFSRELKKMLEERVFSDHNKQQTSSSDMIEVREVLISDFVTQIG